MRSSPWLSCSFLLVLIVATGLLWTPIASRGQVPPPTAGATTGPSAAPATAPAAAAPGAAAVPGVPAAVRPAFFKVTETLLYKIPEGVKVTDSLCSPDSRHIACQESKDGKFWVGLDNLRSPELEWIVGRSLAFSPDGSRFAYQTQHDGLMFAVIGQVGPTWQAVEQPGGYLIGRILFSPDGKHFAYGAQREKGAKMSLVMDGKELAQANEVFVADMQFSNDGKRFACKLRDGLKQRYFVDDALQPPYDAVAGLSFSNDGTRVGYLAQEAKEAMALIDGKEGKRYGMAVGLTFSPDGREYGYVVDTADAAGKLAGRQQLAYCAAAGTPEQLFAPFDRIGAIAFSNDGRRLALTGLNGQKWSLIVDGKIAGTYDGAGMVQFSNDGKRLAINGGRGPAGALRQFIAIDGQELPMVDAVGPASFSPDGAKMAYVVKNGRQHFLMLDQQTLGPASFFAFTPDSRHLGHAQLAPNGESWQVAVDGIGAGPLYDAFPTGSRLVWDSPTVGRLLAARGKEILAVRVELEK